MSSRRRVLRRLVIVTPRSVLLGLAFVGAFAGEAAAGAEGDDHACAVIESGSDGDARAALRAMGTEAGKARRGAGSVAGAIAARLARGPTPPLAEAALEALAELHDRRAGAEGIRYLRHRVPRVRIAAAWAASIGGEGTGSALDRALADPSPEVRAAAAGALVKNPWPPAAEHLGIALAEGVAEAGTALGTWCSRAACEPLLSRIETVPFERIAPGLRAFLGRRASASSSVSDEELARVVARVAALRTPEARGFLAEERKRGFRAGSPKLAAALREATGSAAP